MRVYIPGPDGRAGAAELKPTATAASQHRFLVYHYDHLGSIQTITNWGTATLSTESDSSRKSLFSYEPWGMNRNPISWLGDASNQTTYSAGNGTDSTPRGFTGHEMLEGPFVHMNGRIYSPILSRFMSADPLVQSPANLQSYNRYSYCMNNPLTYVDPSGYLNEMKFGRLLAKYGNTGGDFLTKMENRSATGWKYKSYTGNRINANVGGGKIAGYISHDKKTIKSAHRIATRLQKILMEAMQDKRDILDLNEEALPETDKINLQTSQLTNKVQENLTIINHLIKDFYITIRKELSSPVNILNFREIMDDYIHNISEPSKTALRK